MIEENALRVPLNGYAMQLRLSELASVAAGMGRASAPAGDLLALVEPLRQLPANDRAPTWELAVRHFGRRKQLPRAAGEIGMNPVHAQALLDAYSDRLAAPQAQT